MLSADTNVLFDRESRNQETATAAINAALSCHLVLTTFHDNDSLRAVLRLITMGVEPNLLDDAVVMSQAERLVKKLCSYCKSEVSLSNEIQDLFYKNGFISDQINESIY